jgi:anti-sigma regulatory factor (Ser/Thr protein kinase)
MTSDTKRPATLRVFRYEAAGSTLRSIIGDAIMPASREELEKLARDAMAQRTFVVHAVPGAGQADELCFVPSDERCEILSIHSNGWRRHYGDHRRSLMQILNDLAAAVACGRLRLLDDDELRHELDLGDPAFSYAISDSATLAEARTKLSDYLELLGFDEARREKTVLCASEAATNALVHGGGHGTVSLTPLPDRVRVIVADRGPGLNFLNWLETPAKRAQASMGYGYKIILDHISSVCLHTAASGTTLILDQAG